MDALLAAIAAMGTNSLTQDVGGAEGLGNLQNMWSQISKPEATQSPHDFQAPAMTAPAPNPYASALSFATQPSSSMPALPSAQPLYMPQMRMGNLGMPNSQMMPMGNQMGGQQLAAQAYGRYY